MSDRIKDLLSLLFLAATLATAPFALAEIEAAGVQIELARPPLIA